ncbi:MAG: toprim domain-containing protein [Flavobacterium sp.]|nr:toprim domain-containing protein [Flavobacterium sp.]
MNIEQANAIAMSEILQTIGCKPVKQRGFDLYYHSPFRSENTASFHVNALKNVWYDFGAAKGGDVVFFARSYLQSQNEDDTPADALRWIKNMMSSPTPSLYIPREVEATESGKALTVSKVLELESHSLINYLESRGIPLPIAKMYVNEIIVNNNKTGRKFHAIGLHTEREGFELRNKMFKGCIGPKSITFIRGKQVPAVEVHVFEGVMDFLSAVSREKDYQFMGDVIILNSVSCLPQASPYIKNYVYRTVYTWLDNDKAGVAATEALKELSEKEGILTFQAMNKTYATYKDVNEWHTQKQKLQP